MLVGSTQPTAGMGLGVAVRFPSNPNHSDSMIFLKESVLFRKTNLVPKQFTNCLQTKP